MNQSTAYRDGYWAGQFLLSLKKKVKTRRHVYKTYSFLQVLLIWGCVVIVSTFFYLSRLGGFKYTPQQDEHIDEADVSFTTQGNTVYPQDSF